MLYTDNDMDVVVESLQLADDFSLITDAELTVSLCRLDRKGDITEATNDSPIQVTSVAHGLSDGDQVCITDVEGNTAADGPHTVTVVDADNFELDGSVGSAAYESGGKWYLGVVGAVGLPLTYSSVRKRYRGVLPAGLPIIDKGKYRRIINCSNYGLQWEDDFTAQKRRG